ncbi:hypothetical protein SAMN02745206_00891 [Desulfacinum infernum DSM 9756]|uniref:Peptidase M48 domain-containing protein n=1 Tax=Desulfacinum infernum DSM 9756 TaxID=1121391 RepID=A0A1M4WKK2_9BACT|nr:M48 family metalloprotease [Desulfacinum infernum]SHE81735.1 hypothetical protein SAMN02745206_00891 [Desulfacinum infernum DSM 9756]
MKFGKIVSTVLVFFLGAAAPGPLRAMNLDELYPRQVLQYWQGRYRDNLEWNFRNVVLANLTAAERRRVEGTSLDIPLIAPEQNVPVNFYAYRWGNSGRIVMPVVSVKFLDDFAIASAWLEFNGFSQETAYNYMSMLKYKCLGSSQPRCPPPLEALRIPPDALADPNVDSLSQKILKSAVVFIMAHELGHLYHRHPGYDIPVSQAQENEAQADAFALEVMRRIGTAPMGMVHFFMAALYLMPHRGDFGSEKDWESYLRERSTHPFTGERLRRFAEELRNKSRDFAASEPDLQAATARVGAMAGEVEKIAAILEDSNIQKTLARIGRSTDLDSLRPRPKGGIGRVLEEDDRNPGEARLAFDGLYRGSFSAHGGGEAVPIDVKFERTGDRVTGIYSYGLGQGRIRGRIRDGRLYFRWEEGAETGGGVFIPQNDGKTFQGTWGYETSRDNGGSWIGKRP